MDKFDLYIFNGNLGTGKTTAALKLGKAIDALVLDPDLMRREFGFTEYNPDDTPAIMQEIFHRLIASLIANEKVILSTPYVRQKAREQSYKLINDISKQLGRKLNAVITTCECDETLSKKRMAGRVKDELHSPPTNPASYDRVKRQNETISDDEINDNPDFSFLRYNTDSNKILEVKTRKKHKKAVKNLKQVLLG